MSLPIRQSSTRPEGKGNVSACMAAWRFTLLGLPRGCISREPLLYRLSTRAWSCTCPGNCACIKSLWPGQVRILHIGTYISGILENGASLAGAWTRYTVMSTAQVTRRACYLVAEGGPSKRTPWSGATTALDGEIWQQPARQCTDEVAGARQLAGSSSSKPGSSPRAGKTRARSAAMGSRD